MNVGARATETSWKSNLPFVRPDLEGKYEKKEMLDTNSSNQGDTFSLGVVDAGGNLSGEAVPSGQLMEKTSQTVTC